MYVESKRIILAYPIAATKVWIKGAAMLLFSPSTGHLPELFGMRATNSGILSKFHSLSTIEFIRYLISNELALLLFISLELLWLLIFWIFTVKGIFNTARYPYFPHLVVLSILSHFLIISSGPQTLDRFRLPMLPFLSVCTGVGAATLIRNFRHG
jgi:hypothetical protein